MTQLNKGTAWGRQDDNTKEVVRLAETMETIETSTLTFDFPTSGKYVDRDIELTLPTTYIEVSMGNSIEKWGSDDTFTYEEPQLAEQDDSIPQIMIGADASGAVGGLFNGKTLVDSTFINYYTGKFRSNVIS